MKNWKSLVIQGFFLVLVAQSQAAVATRFQARGVAQSQAAFPKILDETALKSVDPCDDFYQFSCGGWVESTSIPSDRQSVSRQVTAMNDAVDIQLNKILVDYADGNTQLKSTYPEHLANLYTSCMDSEKNYYDQLDLANDYLAKIRRSSRRGEIARLMAFFKTYGAQQLFNLGSMQDLADSSSVVADVSQGGLTLGAAEYYTQTDAKSIEIRQKYQGYVGQIFALMGYSRKQAANIAAKILQMETDLANHAYSIVDASDPDKINHPIGKKGLKKLAPQFDWDSYFSYLGHHGTSINVDEPEFMQYLNTFLTQTKPADLENLMVWQFINSAASSIGGPFEKAHFAFWRSYMNGAKQPLPRWKYCTQEVENNLGYPLAEAYLQTFDGAAIKQKTDGMIDQIKQAFKDDLQILSTGVNAWIDGETLKGALEKIQKMNQKVGAPEKFRNYDRLQLEEDNFLVNSMRIAAFESRRDLAKIGKPVDKSEWGMMPWEVNAYYDRSNNEFVFPYGILQPPSLDLTASDGANFGAFGGGTIGHELTHGFDNNGAKYDADGNLKNWWTAVTQGQFQSRAQCYVDQANNYKIAEVDMTVNGQQTLEENLADQGGVKLGYLALSKILSQRQEASPWLNKYNERQQYWIAYAQSWCTKQTAENLRSQMTTNEHPPAEFRVNAVVMNRPEFARDFNCKAGARMAPANRCSIW